MPLLSHWAAYVERVAEISGHDAEYVWTRMPLSRGEQFLTRWYLKQGIACQSVSAQSPARRKL